MHGLDAVETATLQAAPVSDTASPASPIERAFAALNRLIVLVSSVALVIASAVLTYSVLSRYFLHFSTEWQDELSVFLIVGAVFMSSAAIQARRGHVAIEAIVSLLPERVNRVRQWVVDLASLIFCAFFAWKSWTLLDEAWTEGYHSASTWAPPLWIPYTLMAVGMTLLSLQLLLQVLCPQARARP
jgi:TRAP-type C4-dicarboxylate transport system permease small subunit